MHSEIGELLQTPAKLWHDIIINKIPKNTYR
jgi:hypothetical protein